MRNNQLTVTQFEETGAYILLAQDSDDNGVSLASLDAFFYPASQNPVTYRITIKLKDDEHYSNFVVAMERYNEILGLSSSRTAMAITLNGGPKDGKTTFLLDSNVCKLQYCNGHYVRVAGKEPDQFYWHDSNNR